MRQKKQHTCTYVDCLRKKGIGLVLDQILADTDTREIGGIGRTRMTAQARRPSLCAHKHQWFVFESRILEQDAQTSA